MILDFTPNSKPISEIYLKAIEELVKPYPAHLLPNWELFNQATGGYRTREFTILCGSTGTGKTTLLANWSRALLQSQTKHFIMSVETGETDFVKRSMSCFVGKDINTGDPIPVEVLEEFNRDYGIHYRSKCAYLGLYDNRVPIEVLVNELKYHSAVLGCQIAFIDNLNYFMDIVSERNVIQEMDRVIHELIILCKQIDMHVVMVMHPKKTDGGRVESEFDIKGSSTAVQEAHNVLLFNRPKQEDIDNGKYSWFDREIKFQKMRRRGGYVGKRLILRSKGTQYTEVELL